MNDEVNDSSKARTSITLDPKVLEFVRSHAKENKTSVSQVVEDLIVQLKSSQVEL